MEAYYHIHLYILVNILFNGLLLFEKNKNN